MSTLEKKFQRPFCGMGAEGKKMENSEIQIIPLFKEPKISYNGIMMKLLSLPLGLSILLVGLFSPDPVRGENTESAVNMIPILKSIIQTSEDPDYKPDVQMAMDEMYVLGIINGCYRCLSFGSGQSEGRTENYFPRGAVFPKGISVLQMVRIVYNLAENHPELLHVDYATFVMAALVDKYGTHKERN